MTDLERLFPILKPPLPKPIFNMLIRTGPGGALSIKGISPGGNDRVVRGDHSTIMRQRFAPGFSPAFKIAKC